MTLHQVNIIITLNRMLPTSHQIIDTYTQLHDSFYLSFLYSLSSISSLTPHHLSPLHPTILSYTSYYNLPLHMLAYHYLPTITCILIMVIFLYLITFISIPHFPIPSTLSNTIPHAPCYSYLPTDLSDVDTHFSLS